MKQELKNSGSKSRSRLVRSMMALLLCVAMFAGSTWAWFTDSAENTGNTLQSGTLDIDLLMDKIGDGCYTSISGTQGDIFSIADVAKNDNATLWEPGKTQIAYLAVKNEGNLDALIDVVLAKNADQSESIINNYFEYILLENKKAEDLQSVTSWTELCTMGAKQALNYNRISLFSGKLLKAEKNLGSGESNYLYFAFAVHFKEDTPNEAQNQQLTFNIQVDGKQATSEYDTFGNSYDGDASN